MGMQDDLRAYEDYFTDELTKLINARSKEIQTAYRRIEKKAVAKLEKLDKEIEKLPEEKRQTKRVQREMQRRYVEGLLPDLEQLNAAQNPYIATTLANTFEHGYYTRAFMLEQAAKTPVEIPRLNRSGVLGLVVNDWVGDRRTYSAKNEGRYRRPGSAAAKLQRSGAEFIRQNYRRL